jgi:hypothetical protein
MDIDLVYTTVKIPQYPLFHMVRDTVFLTADRTLPSAVLLMFRIGVKSEVVWRECDP